MGALRVLTEPKFWNSFSAFAKCKLVAVVRPPPLPSSFSPDGSAPQARRQGQDHGVLEVVLPGAARRFQAALQLKRALDVAFQLCWPIPDPELLGAGLGGLPDHSASSKVQSSRLLSQQEARSALTSSLHGSPGLLPLKQPYPGGVRRRKSCSHQPLLPTEPPLAAASSL